MRKALLRSFLVFIFISSFILQGAFSKRQFEISRFEPCDNKERLIKFSGRMPKENGEYYFYFNASLPIELGDRTGLKYLLQTALDGKNYMTITTIREKNVCRAANLYLGDYWYDITRAAKMPVKRCPIPAGNYQLNGVLLNLNKISFDAIPFNNLRVIMDIIDNKNGNSLLCILQEFKSS